MSRLDSPCAASRATCSSCGVSRAGRPRMAFRGWPRCGDAGGAELGAGAVRPRRGADPVEEAPTRAAHAGQRQLSLRLDASTAQHPDTRPARRRSAARHRATRPAIARGCRAGGRRGVVQQRGLADARIAAHHQHTATPRTSARQQPVHDRPLHRPAMQHVKPRCQGQERAPSRSPPCRHDAAAARSPARYPKTSRPPERCARSESPVPGFLIGSCIEQPEIHRSRAR
jgi:hypothetical protein